MSYLVKLIIILVIVKNALLSFVLADAPKSPSHFVSSYITFGDFFDSKNDQHNNPFDKLTNHIWTIGIVTKGKRNALPMIAISKTNSQDSRKELLQPYLNDTLHSDPKSGQVVGDYDGDKDVEIRESFHYKIVAKDTQNNKYWQVLYEGNYIGEIYKFPCKCKYTTKIKNEKYNDQKVFLISDIKLHDKDQDLSIISKASKKKSDVDVFMHISNFGDKANYDDLENLDDLYQTLTIPLSTKPYLISPSYSMKPEFAYRALNFRFRMPGGQDDVENRNNAYSCKINGVYFLTFNHNFMVNDVDLAAKIKFYAWFVSEYKNAYNSKYRIFFSHQPTFCANINDASCNYLFYLYKPVEDLLRKFNFDLALHGKTANYSRMRKIYSFQLAENSKSTVNVGKFYKEPLYIILGYSIGKIQETPGVSLKKNQMIDSKHIIGTFNKALTLNITEKYLHGTLENTQDDNLQDYFMITPQILPKVIVKEKLPKQLSFFDSKYIYVFILICCISFLSVLFMMCFIISCIKARKRRRNIVVDSSSMLTFTTENTTNKIITTINN